MCGTGDGEEDTRGEKTRSDPTSRSIPPTSTSSATGSLLSIRRRKEGCHRSEQEQERNPPGQTRHGEKRHPEGQEDDAGGPERTIRQRSGKRRYAGCQRRGDPARGRIAKLARKMWPGFTGDPFAGRSCPGIPEAAFPAERGA